MPEKTRDRKSWFPRFKSNWLGTFRSKEMFHCCECAVPQDQLARYKGAEGKHCACGKDEWHLAKAIEEKEYNRRISISKAYGGMRYEEALQHMKTTGRTEPLDLKRRHPESLEAPQKSMDFSHKRTNMTNLPLMNPMMMMSNASPATARFAPIEFGFSLGEQNTNNNPFNLTISKPKITTTALPINPIALSPLNFDYNTATSTIAGSNPFGSLFAPTPLPADEKALNDFLRDIFQDEPRLLMQPAPELPTTTVGF